MMAATILIVTRNRPDFLTHVLSEIAQRVRAEDEVLVIDDGSEVAVDNALKEVSLRCQINYVRHDQQAGYIARRNEGILAACNECILQLDDDSWPVESDAIARCERALAENAKVGGFALPIHHHWSKAHDGCGRISARWKTRHLARECAFMGCGVILRRSAVVDAGLYPAYYVYGGEETALTMRLHRIGFEVRMFRAVRIIHGHEILSAAPAYGKTRTSDPRPGIIANQLCLAEESYPWPLNHLICNSIRFLARFKGVSLVDVERSYQVKRPSIDPLQRLTPLKICSWGWVGFVRRAEQSFAGTRLFQ